MKSISRRKAVLYILIINLSLLLVMELLARGLFWGLSGDAISLLYGFDRDIKASTRHRPLWNVRFYRDCVDCLAPPQQQTAEPVAMASTLPRASVWAFGGSTTQGYGCSSRASSWPDELEALDSRLDVTNFGKNGANSDYSIHQLIIALEKQTPDLVLWTDWFNEKNVIYDGLDRNRDELVPLYPDLIEGKKTEYRYNSVRHFVRRLDVSLNLRSSLYLLLKEIWARIAVRLGMGERQDAWQPTDDQSIEMAVSNYAINLRDALELAELRGFKLAIVRLPRAPLAVAQDDPAREWEDPFEERLYRRLHEFASDFAAAHRIPLLDVHAWYNANGNKAEYFCDGVHQYREGHQATAQAIITQWPLRE
jgi:lysophospholipase L1-like esterase